MSSERVLAPRGRSGVQKSAKAARRPNLIGSAGQVSVQVDPALGGNGVALGQAILATAQGDYDRVVQLFNVPSPPAVVISIEQISPGSDGTGGAWHASCQDGTLHVDASFNNADRTAALWIAEFVEVLEAWQAAGWDCGNTNGEGLSRFVAEWAYPGALDDYSTAAAWLDGSRPDFVNSQQGTDTDEQSNGCAALFLWWLSSQGTDAATICRAAAPTLAGTYLAIRGDADAWGAFQAACAAAWPPGQPSGVKTDNPWPGVQPGGPAPGPAPGPGDKSLTLTLPADVPAGNYLLVNVGPLMNRARVARMAPAALAELLGEAFKLFLAFISAASSTSSTSSPAMTVNPAAPSPKKGGGK